MKRMQKSADLNLVNWSESEWKDEMTEKPRVDREGHSYKMRADEVDDFLMCMSRDEVWFDCRGHKFLVNGCQCEFDRLGRTVMATLELYELDAGGNVAEVMYRVAADSPISCVRAFVRNARICGKTIAEMRTFIRWRK